MQKLNQKEAVFAAIVSVTGFVGDGVLAITKEQRAQVNAILFESFRAGKIALDREYTDSDLKSYVSGLQSNWIRKDKRLNGGMKYEPKNPGSRAGSTDEQLKAIRALKGQTPKDHPHYADIVEAETARMSEIAATKVQKTVDLTALPEALRTKFGG